MGWRFSKRVKILPGVSLNLSKSGVSTSLGPPGAKVTIGHGKVRQTVGIPGTGISYTESTSLSPPQQQQAPSQLPVVQPAQSGWVVAGQIAVKVLYWLTIGVIVVVAGVLLGLLSGSSSKRKRW